MSVPKALFIDTSILDGQNYNFESEAISLLLAAAKNERRILLLPDATYREIKRHISARADAVINALASAYRKAPFMAKSKNWPSVPGFAQSWELFQIGMQEWNRFMSNFTLVDLPIDQVNLREVMDWHESQRTPFGPKKKKEFPDAFALSSV